MRKVAEGELSRQAYAVVDRFRDAVWCVLVMWAAGHVNPVPADAKQPGVWMREDWIEYYHAWALSKVALTFVLPFIVFLVLLLAWTNKASGKPTGLSPISASMMLASIAGALYYCIILRISSPSDYITGEIIRAVLLFPTIFLILLPLCIIYFVSVFRRWSTPSGKTLGIIVIACLAIELFWVGLVLGPR